MTVARELTTAELERFHELEWRDLQPRLSADVRGGLETVLEAENGDAITVDQQRLLAYAGGDDLLGVLCAANCLRQRLVGDVVTYIVNRNINFTNVCFV